MNKKDYKILVDCLEQKERDDGEKFYCRKEGTPKHIETIMQDIMFENDNHDFDLDYEIMNDALNVLYDVDYKDLKDLDIYENSEEYASVYTTTRISYLNMWTQDEISEVLKECECDIQTACAIWYDRQVETILQELLTVINE